jgi:hypothetical protein
VRFLVVVDTITDNASCCPRFNVRALLPSRSKTRLAMLFNTNNTIFQLCMTADCNKGIHCTGLVFVLRRRSSSRAMKRKSAAAVLLKKDMSRARGCAYCV